MYEEESLRRMHEYVSAMQAKKYFKEVRKKEQESWRRERNRYMISNGYCGENEYDVYLNEKERFDEELRKQKEEAAKAKNAWKGKIWKGE